MGEYLLLLIGPIVTASATAGSVWLREVQQRRDREHRRRRTIEQATQELILIGTWINAHERLRALELNPALTQRVSLDLERAYSVLATPVVADPISTEPLRSRWSVSSFLLRDIRRGWARFVRIFYYLFLIVAVVWSIASFAILGTEGITVLNVFTSLILAMIGVLPALGMYKLTRRIDRAVMVEG
jgi:hypothetical protein